MIKYFSELETPNQYYLDLVEYGNHKYNSNVQNIPISAEYSEKISKLIKKINEYDLLYDNYLKIKPMYLNISECDYDYPMAYNWYMQNNDTYLSGLTESGANLVDLLKQKYQQAYNGTDFFHDFFEYYVTCMHYLKHQFHIKSKYPEKLLTEYKANLSILSDRKTIESYIRDAYNMALYQNKVCDMDRILFDDVLNYLHNSNIKLPSKNYSQIKYYLPNAWYITPFNHLYNSMGPGGHREANVHYQFSCIFNNDKIENEGFKNLRHTNKIIKEGFITKSEYTHFTNLIPEFLSVLPDEYYKKSSEDKFKYQMLDRRTYNPKIVKLVAGIISAHAGLFTKFENLKDKSSNYKSDLEFIKQFSEDEILIRFCGFHKISSAVDKTITTSDINYLEDFKEYIDRGWTIDFIKPIVLNYKGRLEELSDDFIKIKTFRKK